MPRFSAGARMTNAPTSTLPGMSAYASAGSGFALRELWVFNTTATACQIALRKLTTAGTQGAAVDEMKYDDDTAAAAATVVNSHTVGPTITAGNIALATLGAAVGSFVVWTFGGDGLKVQPGTANGLGILTPTGTGQICDCIWVFDE